jgi:protein TonB
MPADLFAAPARDVAARSRQSSLVAASFVAHAALFAALVLISLLLPDVLPAPRTALAWDAGPQMVRLIDIPLPPTPPARTPAVTPPASADAAPVVAPEGIVPEPETPPGTGPERTLQPGLVQGDFAEASLAVPPPPPQHAEAPPSQPVRLHTGIDAPVKINDVMPVYPALARSAGAQGVVIIEAAIDIEGNVTSAKVLRSIPLLDAAAVDAVRQWKYTPARLNGQPVPVIVTVTVNFTLGR